MNLFSRCCFGGVFFFVCSVLIFSEKCCWLAIIFPSQQHCALVLCTFHCFRLFLRNYCLGCCAIIVRCNYFAIARSTTWIIWNCFTSTYNDDDADDDKIWMPFFSRAHHNFFLLFFFLLFASFSFGFDIGEKKDCDLNGYKMEKRFRGIGSFDVRRFKCALFAELRF